MALTRSRAALLGGLLMLSLVSMASAASKPPAHKPPARRPPVHKPRTPTAYRLISITKWNVTANVTDLQAAEVSVSLACKQYYSSGVTGSSTDDVEDVLWGSHIKVYDFPTILAYTNYSQCVSRQPGRAYSQPYEVWKNRAIFAYYETVEAATAGTLWSVSLSNVTDRAAALAVFTEVQEEVAPFLAVAQAAETLNGAVALQLDVAHVLTYKKLQGVLAVSGYLNEDSLYGIPPLDTLVKLAPLLTRVRRINFVPNRLV